ncbi:hypothetical protein K8R33_02280 [archaeon]|nr:hypothetical protein [archaeon]
MIKKIMETAGLIAVLTALAIPTIKIDIKGLQAINRLGREMENSQVIEHVMQEGETYLSLLRGYFPIQEREYPEINAMNGWENGGGAENCPQDYLENTARNLYRTHIARINGHKFYELWNPAEGDIILVPVRS